MKLGAVAFAPWPSGTDIHPYIELLLHDMGEGLADGREDFEAGPRDWRTPPLWGLGLAGRYGAQADFLHDGRTRSVMEAILWHGGEAEAAAQGFRGLAREEREALLAFLGSLEQSLPAYDAGVTQSQNVGEGHFWGGEISVDYRVAEELSLGGNLTLMRRSVYAPYILNFQPTGVPDGKMFLYTG
ncbi:di-heme oxidoredictase family protein [Methylosinus sp. Ce-a6]|uniref:di-heme oxidoredictase family protein n=1 Tax=Methylosinus sp. Ce-a6 TaxID=2172005 RepID=UPI00278BFD92|nr:di-heme oxidoredictase family protein [Methylosinus sp. Ce-a6]